MKPVGVFKLVSLLHVVVFNPSMLKKVEMCCESKDVLLLMALMGHLSLLSHKQES